MRNAELDEAQGGIKTAWRNLSNLRYADDIIFMAENEELKSVLMKVKDESEKLGLKLNIQKTKIMASGPITSWQIDRETMETLRDFTFLGSQITADIDCSHEIKRHLLLEKKSYDEPRQHIKKQTHYFANKVLSSQGYGFSSGHVWLWELTIKKAECWKIDAFELWCWSPLDCKEIQPVHLIGNQSWVFIGRTDVEAETPVLIWKDPDAGKDWGQEEKGTTEDEMVGWHHRLNGHEFG